MKDKTKNYTMIALSVLLLTSLGFNAMPEPTHYCDAKEIKAYCFDVSSTLKTCYTLPNKAGGKVCDDLWKKIPDKIEAITETEKCLPYVIAYTDSGKYFCDKIGKDAKCVLDNTLQLPVGG